MSRVIDIRPEVPRPDPAAVGRHGMLLGIDGGGTHCRGAVVVDGRRFDATGGAANATTDPVGTRAALEDLLDRLARRSGVSRDVIARATAHLAIAGVRSPGQGAALARDLNLPRARVTEDWPAAIAGALGGGDGIVAGIGTGSFLARQQGGLRRSVGGWGMALGDEASGAWLGLRALACVMAVTDGLEPETAMTVTLMRRFADVQPDLPAYALTARPADLALLAPIVVAAAHDGDPAAARLLSAGAAYVARTATTLGWEPGVTLVLTGGLGPVYENLLPPGMVPDLAAPLGSALDGALALAAEAAAACPSEGALASGG